MIRFITAARKTFGESFHVGGNLGNFSVMRKSTGACLGDADGDAHYGKLRRFACAVKGFDKTLLQIGGVIQSDNQTVEGFDNF